MGDRRLPTLAAACVLWGFTAAPTSAQTTETTFDACYVPEVGAIYLINQTGLPTSCLSRDHVQVSWTEGGGVSDHGQLTGLADDDHPEYVREGEPAAGDLTGAFPGPSVAGLQGNPLSATAPSDGQVLTWNGTNGEWEPRTPPTGVNDHGNLSGLADDDHRQYVLVDGVRNATDGFAVAGTFDTGVIPTEGAGVRLMWYPGKAAFRAGQVGRGTPGTEWDDANVGDHSTAFGQDTEASASQSTAMGLFTTASGQAATAMGRQATASGSQSTAMGFNTTASGPQSVAMGRQATASGSQSTAMGFNTTASGSQSTAMGSGTTVSGLQAAAMGRFTTAQAHASLVIGQFNVVEGSQDAWVSTDPLFVAGNGRTATLLSNALTLLKNGDLTIAGTLTESSDARLKEEVEPLGEVLEHLHSIEPVRFRFRDGTGNPADVQIGLLAQQVEEVFPELVSRDSQGYLSLAYPKLAAVLVKALQEQQEQIQERDEALEALRVENERLADRLDRLEEAVQRIHERDRTPGR